MTSSFGVSQIESGDVVHDVVRRADKALYQAKETGRNKVCSMTKLEQNSASPEKQVKSEAKTTEFEYHQTLTACTSSDMIIYKLKAFLEANHAVLKEVNSERVQMRVGKPGLLTNWGKAPERQPVDLVLEFEKKTRKQGAHNVAEIRVIVTPAVKPPSNQKFQNRAGHVVRSLREYLAGS
ncbi:MAG: hypothetical protein R3C11_01905 [Planctomycetaceae bacterium]